MLRTPFVILVFLVQGCQVNSDSTHEVGESIADGATEGELVVTHSPNPCNKHSNPLFEKDRFEYMWYYRTTVANNSDVPLRIIWFEGFSRLANKWIPGNVMGRDLTGRDFGSWYTEGDPTPDGVISPGNTAACNPNYHGSHVPTSSPVKWAFRAIAPDGTQHYAEAVIESVPIE